MKLSGQQSSLRHCRRTEFFSLLIGRVARNLTYWRVGPEFSYLLCERFNNCCKGTDVFFQVGAGQNQDRESGYQSR